MYNSRSPSFSQTFASSHWPFPGIFYSRSRCILRRATLCSIIFVKLLWNSFDIPKNNKMNKMNKWNNQTNKMNKRNIARQKSSKQKCDEYFRHGLAVVKWLDSISFICNDIGWYKKHQSKHANISLFTFIHFYSLLFAFVHFYSLLFTCNHIPTINILVGRVKSTKSLLFVDRLNVEK